MNQFLLLCALHFATLTKNPYGDISGTKRGIIDPLVSKRPEKKILKISEKIPNKILKENFWKPNSDKNVQTTKIWNNKFKQQIQRAAN